MENIETPADKIINGISDFNDVLDDCAINFNIFSEYFQQNTQCDQTGLAPLLTTFETMANAFSHYVEILCEIIHNCESMTIIRNLPQEKRNFEEIPVSKLLAFHGLGMYITGVYSHKNIPIPYLNQKIYELAVYYGYYGCSMCANTSLISKLNTFTLLLGSDFGESDELFELLPALMAKEYVPGLRLMARRASFLATATDDEIRNNEVSWWCDQMDMTPKDESQLYQLSGFIMECPDLTHPEVQKRLTLLSTHPGVDETNRQEAKDALLKLT